MPFCQTGIRVPGERHRIFQFSIFLMLGQFLNVVVTTPPYRIIIPLLLHSCNFSTALNRNVNAWNAGRLICNPQRGLAG